MTTAPRWIPACVGLGSNLNSPLAQVRQAAGELDALPKSTLIRLSSLYASKPMGPDDQPDYINAVAALLTQLSAHDLLSELRKIEQAHGRERGAERWGPRTLDLDLLLFGSEIIDDEALTVPHAGIAERNFVLLPLCELAPHWIVPGRGSVRSLLSSLAAAGDGIEKLGSESA